MIRDNVLYPDGAVEEARPTEETAQEEDVDAAKTGGDETTEQEASDHPARDGGFGGGEPAEAGGGGEGGEVAYLAKVAYQVIITPTRLKSKRKKCDMPPPAPNTRLRQPQLRD